MSDLVRIELKPLGKTLEVKRGTPLQDILFATAWSSPAEGAAAAGVAGCECWRASFRSRRNRRPPLTRADCRRLAAGLPLSRGRATSRSKSPSGKPPSWRTNPPSPSRPREGLGIAVDLGTTTLVAQLLDLAHRACLGVRTALNPQVAYGSDVMSRVEMGLNCEGLEKLGAAIRRGSAP